MLGGSQNVQHNQWMVDVWNLFIWRSCIAVLQATSQSYAGGSVKELHFFRRKKKNSTSPGHKLNATAQDEKQKAVCPSANGLPGQAAIWHDPTENCLVLVGGFNPLETVKHTSQIRSFPQVGMKIQNIWVATT